MLQEVSDEMKGDVQKEKGIKAAVMKAVTQDWTGLALEFVSEEKKG